MTKIDSTLFSQHDHRLEQQACPQCGALVVIKQSKRGLFKSCITYPNCDFTQALTQNDGHIVKKLGIACPQCGDELVLRQGRFGMFIGCASYPACEHREKREQLTEPAQQIPCPECGVGHLLERQSRFGKRFYACDTYPRCKLVINFKPIIGQCSDCDYPLLVEKKTAAGNAVYCANKKCQLKQS